MLRCVVLSLLLLCVPMYSWACEYGDDPRLESDAAALVQAIRSGEETSQIRMTLGTYLGMGKRTKALFGDQVLITSMDCKPIGVFEGDIMGIVMMPFEGFYKAMARAIRKDQPAVAKQLMAHARVAAMPVEQYVDLFGLLPFERTGGLLVREKMKRIFPAAGRYPPQKEWLKDPLQQGRMDDYTMARLFRLFGGQLEMDKNCGPYTLSQKFYSVEQVKTLFGGMQDRIFARQEPAALMLQVMGSAVQFTDATHYQIKGCTP